LNGRQANLYGYASANPLRYYDPEGSSIYSRIQEVTSLLNAVQSVSDYVWSLLPTSVQSGQVFGTGFGNEAVDYWSARHAQSNGWLDATAGTFASLWTPEMWSTTSGLLTGARGLQSLCGVPRSYWQYYPKGNSSYTSPWLAPSRTNQAPYSLGQQAREALNLPLRNPGTAVRRVNVHWLEPIRGPRTPLPRVDLGWPLSGKGNEVIRGWRWK